MLSVVRQFSQHLIARGRIRNASKVNAVSGIRITSLSAYGIRILKQIAVAVISKCL